MNRPDVLLLILPIIGVLAWHTRLIHRYGWQSELREEEPTREPSWGRRPAAERPLASGLTSEGPRPSSSQSPGCLNRTGRGHLSGKAYLDHGRLSEPWEVGAAPSNFPGCYYAPVELCEPDPWEDTFDRWRARERAARP